MSAQASIASATYFYSYIDVTTELYGGSGQLNGFQAATTTSSQTSTTTVDELVIIGRRPPEWPTNNLPLGSIAFDDGYYGILKQLPDGTLNPNYTYGHENDHIISIDVSAANMGLAVQLMLRLAPVVATWSSKISFMGDSQWISTGYGQLRTGDVQSVWGEINIKIVETINGTANANVAMVWDFAPDGTYRPTMLFTPNILNYHADPAQYPNNSGLNYVIGHEIAHMTRVGNDVFNTQYKAYLDAGGKREDWNDINPINPWRETVEHAANNVGINLAIYLGLPVDTSPTYGW